MKERCSGERRRVRFTCCCLGPHTVPLRYWLKDRRIRFSFVRDFLESGLTLGVPDDPLEWKMMHSMSLSCSGCSPDVHFSASLRGTSGVP